MSLLMRLALFLGAAGVTLNVLRPPRPPALMAPTSLELGDQEFGTISVGRMTFANTGGRILKVGPFATSCSCAGIDMEETTAEGPVWKRVTQLSIEPETSVTVAVRIAIGGTVGESQVLSVAADTNDPVMPRWSINVTIPRVTGSVLCHPSAIVFDSTGGGLRSERVTIYANGNNDRKITGVKAFPPDQFSVKLLPLPADVAPHPVGGMAIGIIEITLSKVVAGRISGTVAIAVNGREPDDREMVRITGQGCVTAAMEKLP